MKKLVSALAGVTLAVGIRSAGAWEAQTTHAGLAEQAALASRLHAMSVIAKPSATATTSDAAVPP